MYGTAFASDSNSRIRTSTRFRTLTQSHFFCFQRKIVSSRGRGTNALLPRPSRCSDGITSRYVFTSSLGHTLPFASFISDSCSFLRLPILAAPCTSRISPVSDIGNLHPKVTVMDLEPRLVKFGTITNLWVAKNPPGKTSEKARPTCQSGEYEDLTIHERWRRARGNTCGFVVKFITLCDLS